MTRIGGLATEYTESRFHQNRSVSSVKSVVKNSWIRVIRELRGHWRRIRSHLTSVGGTLWPSSSVVPAGSRSGSTFPRGREYIVRATIYSSGHRLICVQDPGPPPITVGETLLCQYPIACPNSWMTAYELQV